MSLTLSNLELETNQIVSPLYLIQLFLKLTFSARPPVRLLWQKTRSSFRL